MDGYVSFANVEGPSHPPDEDDEDDEDTNGWAEGGGGMKGGMIRGLSRQ